MKRFGALLLALLGLVPLSLIPRLAHAAESYSNCTGFITALPKVISTPGIWCFNQNLSFSNASGKAINLQADNVTLDCNDFTLDGRASGGGTYGIYTDGQRHMLTVRHCNIRGFRYGIVLGGNYTKRYLVEDNRLDGVKYQALHIEGEDSVVRRNRVFDTGGSTITTDVDAYGIYALHEIDLLDNTVVNVTARSGGNGTAYGIYTSSITRGSINGNQVRGLIKDGTGIACGICNDGSGRISLRENVLVGDSSAGSVGLRCVANQGGRAKDNVINGFSVGISGCNDDGGNAFKP